MNNLARFKREHVFERKGKSRFWDKTTDDRTKGCNECKRAWAAEFGG